MRNEGKSVKFIHLISASDSSGGAGMQQDVRTVSENGFHPVCSLSGITVQTFEGVKSVSPAGPEVFAAQLDSSRNFKILAVKVGALLSLEQIAMTAEYMKSVNLPAVIDPVFRPSSGMDFYSRKMKDHFLEKLLPLAQVIVPNRTELEIIFGRKFGNIEEAAEFVFQHKPPQVNFVLKGGHFEGNEITEAVIDGEIRYFTKKREIFTYSHGTGCMISSLIACGLAEGRNCYDSFRSATVLVSRKYRSLNQSNEHADEKGNIQC